MGKTFIFMDKFAIRNMGDNYSGQHFLIGHQ